MAKTRGDQEQPIKDIIRHRKRFNGKPLSHWETIANELVIDSIVRAALQSTDDRSIIGYLARRRLLEIAKLEDPVVYKKVLAERRASIKGFLRALRAVL